MRRRGAGIYERGEFFSLLEQRENCILWKTNASKQAEPSRGEERERQMGMGRKSGKDKETFAEWKTGEESLLPV